MVFTGMADILRNALVVQDLFNPTLIPGMALGLQCKEMIVFMERNTVLPFFHQKHESRSDKSRSCCANTHSDSPFANRDAVLQNESLRHSLRTHTHTHAHMSWLWALIWDHDKHAADGACRERACERETETESEREPH